MKNLVLVVLMLVSSLSFAQVDAKVEKKGDLTMVTYYHDNGNVEQEGTFNAKGELHGVWTSYDLKGNKVAVGNYNNGQKSGKWFFWVDDTLKEVDYKDSKIASVQEWKQSTDVAIRN